MAKGEVIVFFEAIAHKTATRRYGARPGPRVVRFPGHTWAHCRRECDGCFLCHGGLALCVTCGGLEGSLTTDCPGSMVSESMADSVYAGQLDYRRDRGWICEAVGWRRRET